jgi:hypothetical protein
VAHQGNIPNAAGLKGGGILELPRGVVGPRHAENSAERGMILIAFLVVTIRVAAASWPFYTIIKSCPTMISPLKYFAAAARQASSLTLSMAGVRCAAS